MTRQSWLILMAMIFSQPLASALAAADAQPTGSAATPAAAPATAAADTASQPPDPSNSPDQQKEQKLQELQQITVTGRRPMVENSNVTLGAFGNKSTMEVPLSMESFSSAQLQNSQARTLQDVLSNDPGVQNDNVNADYSNPSIRGFQSDWTNTIRRNDLNLAPYQETPLEEIERVTVLEGPSGFLYGFNSPGGTIDYITKQPTLDPFTELTVQRRTENGWYAHLDTSDTLGSSKTFGYRLNVGHEQEGEFTSNFGMRRDFGAGALEWKPGPNTVLQLNADYQKAENSAAPVLGVVTGGTLPPMPDPWKLLGEPWLQYRADVYNVGARMDTQLNDTWSITAQAAFSQNVRFTAFPRITSVLPNGNVTGGKLQISPDQKYRVGSGQLFATGEFKTFDIAHELVFGVSAEKYKALEAGYINLPITVGNIFDPVYVPQPVLPPAPGKNHNNVTQASPFASDLISLTDHWQALLGARYIQFKNTITSPTAATTTYDRDKIVPNVGLIYRPVKSLMFYTDYTQGLEQSQPAPSYALNAGATLAPLTSTQYEIGTKMDIRGRFSVRVDAFQVTQNLQYVDSQLYLVEGGQQRHRGFEVAANGRVTDDLTISTGLSRLFTTQIDTGSDAVNGKRTPNAPDWQANVSFDYQLPAFRQVFVEGALVYVGNRAVDSANTVFAPSYTTMDLGVRCVCQVFGENTILRLNAKNLTNRRYWASADLTGVFPGIPFTLYASATFEF